MRGLVVAFAAVLAMGCGGADAPAAQPASGHDHHGAEHHGPLVHRFENAEEWSARFDDPKRDAWQRPDHVVERLGVAPGMTVADIGAGTGYFVPYLSAAVGDAGRVLALDIEESMVDFMKKRAAKEAWKNVEARVVAGGDPGLPEASVDRILIVDTWHHIPERSAYASKLRQVLVEGGMVAVVDFDLASLRGPPREHKLPPEKVAEELRAGGLTAEILEEELPDQYIVVGRR